METLSIRARSYIALVVLCGCAIIIYSFIFHPLVWNLSLLSFVFMAALTGPATVKIGSRIEMSPVFPFSFSGFLIYGLSGMLIIGIINILASCFIRKKSLGMPKVIFNVFSVSISLFITGLTFEMICQGEYSLSNESFLGAVLMATLVFYLVNTFLVTGIVSITERKWFFTLWREKFIWTAPSYYAGSSFAVGLAFLVDRLGVPFIILALPPCAVIYYFYRLYTVNSEEKQKLLMTIKQLQESTRK